MKNWINHPIELRGELVELIPLDQIHFAELRDIAKEKKIWEFLPSDGSDPEKFSRIFAEALEEREKGNQYPFVVRHKEAGKLIGSTRYLDIQPKDRKLEIGWTWYHPEFWGTAINFECKLLLLTYAFEKLGAVRVQLKTSDQNIRSRKAIEKIGGKFEGILRKDRIKEDGTFRNSAYYSIIDEEWPGLKEKLRAMYEERKNQQVNLS